jgi:CheY-like chemotaxis protein
MKKDQPCGFYFNTSVLLLDDSQSFLDNLKLRLHNFNTKGTTSPEEALMLIKKNDETEIFKRNFLYKQSDKDESTDQDLDINFIQKEILNLNKSEHFSIVVVDYDMPEMNGAIFCEKIKNNQIKKIMLTGQADEQVAVSLFNCGNIHKFIRKNATTMIDELTKAITELQQCYFFDTTRGFLEILSSNNDCILSQNEFSTIFKSLKEKHNIVEYYLMDKQGSFIMLDADKNKYYFTAVSENKFNDFYQIALDNRGEPTLLQELKNRTKMPVLINDDDYKLPIKEWSKHLHTPELFKGKTNFYYVLLKNPRQISQ